MQSNDMVLSVAFSPDGKRGAGNLEGIKPDGPAHRRRAGFEPVRSGRVESLAYSPDGGLLAVGTGMVTRLLDTAILQEIDTLAGKTQTVKRVASRLTAGCWRRPGSWGWSYGTWERVDAPVKLDTRTDQRGVVFSADGTRLASLTSNAVRLYDPETRRMMMELQQTSARTQRSRRTANCWRRRASRR